VSIWSIEYQAAAMVPKPSGGAITPKGAPRLPPLPKLKIKRPNKVEANPCVGVLSSVLGAHPSITVTSGMESWCKHIQVAGHRQDTRHRDAHSWNSNCERAWTQEYVFAFLESSWRSWIGLLTCST